MKTNNRPRVRKTEALETDASLGNHLVKTTTTEAKRAGENFIEQLLGFDSAANDNEPNNHQSNENLAQAKSYEASGNKDVAKSTEKGIIFDLKTQLIGNNFFNKERRPARVEPGIEYHSEYYRAITKSREIHTGRENSEQNKQIQQIMIELKKLITSTKALQSQFGEISVETAPSNPGKYYVNFFDWLLIMIKQARQKAEDSKAWLETLKGKSKKLNYWGMAKKHGTTFSQGNERNVATSTG